MTDKAVDSLTAASALTGTELLYGDDGVNDVKITATQVKTFTNKPAGSDTQVQFNDSGAFGGAAQIKYDKTTGNILTGTQSISSQFSTATGIFQVGGLDASNNTHLVIYDGVSTGTANVRAIGDQTQHMSMSMNGSGTAGTGLLVTPLLGCLVTDTLSTGGLLINSRAGTGPGSWAPIYFALGHLNTGFQDEVGRFDTNGDFKLVYGLKFGSAAAITGIDGSSIINTAGVLSAVGSGSPSGSAGGALAGTYPSPTFAGTVATVAHGVVVPATSSTPVSHTGDTAETTLATIVVPAIPAKASLRLTFYMGGTTSANVKTTKLYYGAAGSGTGGALYKNIVPTTNSYFTSQFLMLNVSTSSQMAPAAPANLLPNLGITSNLTSAVTTTVATELNITGTLASSGETITLLGYTLEIILP